MKFTVMTLFPEQVRSFLETSITGRALAKNVFAAAGADGVQGYSLKVDFTPLLKSVNK